MEQKMCLCVKELRHEYVRAEEGKKLEDLILEATWKCLISFRLLWCRDTALSST
jgi:hypothetical protein